MAYKDLGPNVSQNPQSTSLGGSFSAEDRSYESLIIQNNSPVIDWEVNLGSEINNDYGLRSTNQLKSPSHFIEGDFLESSDPGVSYAALSPIIGNENQLILKSISAIVNGWPIKIEYSDTVTPGENLIILSVPPIASTRTDLVILEVWRALIRSAPVITNKSATGLILRHGNAKAPDAVNLTDDLIDPTYTLESNARVQIQYRLRVISGIDIQAYPDGLEDPTVVAHSVPDYLGPGVDGNPTAYVYTVTDHDKSLWRAGTGSAGSAVTLGTIDGYIYAIPVCAIHRRNSSAFDRVTNLNGGDPISAGTSTRPDGLFNDQIVISDIRDLRKGLVSDFKEVLDKAVCELFQNSLSSSSEKTLDDTAGTSFLARDDINSTSQLDASNGIRQYFSYRSITETIVAKVQFGAPPQTTFSIDLTSFLPAWAVIPYNAQFPTTIKIVGIKSLRLVLPGGGGYEIDAIAIGDLHSVILASATVANFTLNTPYSNVIAYVELLIEFESGYGTSRNAIEFYQVWTPTAATLGAWVDPTILTATSDPNRYNLDTTLWNSRIENREVGIKLLSIDQTETFFSSTDGISTYIYIWERLTVDAISINDGINPVYTTTNFTINTAYTRVTLNFALPANTPVQVTYKAYRPLPYLSAVDSCQIFYRSRAIQSIPVPAGNQTLELIPRSFGDLYSILTSVSSNEAIDFLQPSEQIPIALLPPSTHSEYLLNGVSGSIDGNTFLGLWKLGNSLPYLPNPQSVTLYKAGIDTVIDGDQRHYWPKSDNGTLNIYQPMAKSQGLVADQFHKTILPVIMELKTDFSSIGKKGTLVLVLFASTSYGKQNEVFLSEIPGSGISGTCAAIFRLRGNLMNNRRYT